MNNEKKQVDERKWFSKLGQKLFAVGLIGMALDQIILPNLQINLPPAAEVHLQGASWAFMVIGFVAGVVSRFIPKSRNHKGIDS